VVANRYVERRTGFINRRHSHPVYHLMYITDGEGTFEVGDSTTRALPGMRYWISPNEPHRFEASLTRPLSNFASTFVLRWEDGVPAEIPFPDLIEEYAGTQLPSAARRSPCIVPPQFRPAVENGFRQTVAPAEAPSRDIRDKLRVLDLIVRIADTVGRIGQGAPGRKNGSAVTELLRYMETNLHRALTLEELARHIHVTPNYLCRMFKRETGATPRQYVQKLRMEKAMERLVDTDEPVYGIAERLGFESASYFARVFRAKHGVTPSVFRELQKG
jgi:AraC-like DNA-binding protein